MKPIKQRTRNITENVSSLAPPALQLKKGQKIIKKSNSDQSYANVNKKCVSHIQYICPYWNIHLLFILLLKYKHLPKSGNN